MYQLIFLLAFIAIGFSLLNTGASLFKETRVLHKKFYSLGNVIGKSYKEIASVCGSHNMYEDLGDGNKTYTWADQDYSITFLFDSNNIARKMIKEYVRK